MAEAADMAPAQQLQAARVAKTAGDVSATAMLQQFLALLFPSSLAAKAALLALVVALLPLLPSGSSGARVWELPHLLLLGIIISYGVFGQKNADADAAEVAAAADAVPVVDDEASVEAYVSQMMHGSHVFEDSVGIGGSDDGAGGKDGFQAWSSQYLRDDPLVVVADTAGTNDGGTGDKPLLLPVRKLKPAAEKSAATPAGDMDMNSGSGIEEEEAEEELLLAPKAAGYDVVRERAIPSPSSVLDADLTLSPVSSPPLLPPPPPPPPPPPFLGRGGRSLGKPKARSFNEFGGLINGNDRSPNGSSLGSHGHSAGSKQFRFRSAVQATRSTFAARYDPVVPIDDEGLGEMVAAASDSSFSSDLDDDTIIKEENSCKDDGVDEDDGTSCDEELFELPTTSPGPEVETEAEEVEDEVDRKADEFIAKFREQIRMQRVDPARR